LLRRYILTCIYHSVTPILTQRGWCCSL